MGMGMGMSMGVSLTESSLPLCGAGGAVGGPFFLFLWVSKKDRRSSSWIALRFNLI